MKKYFTTLDSEDGKFVGMLHDPDTNQVVYKTKPYSSQSQVTSDINQHITQLKMSHQQPQQSQTIVNTVRQQTFQMPKRTCCGR